MLLKKRLKKTHKVAGVTGVADAGVAVGHDITTGYRNKSRV